MSEYTIFHDGMTLPPPPDGWRWCNAFRRVESGECYAEWSLTGDGPYVIENRTGKTSKTKHLIVARRDEDGSEDK